MSKELTIQDALVITKCGWSTEVDEELVNIAFVKLRKEARRLHLEYQKEKIEKELNQNKGCCSGCIDCYRANKELNQNNDE